MQNLLTNNGFSDLLVYGLIFLLGVVLKSRIQWGKTNSDVLETLTRDYKSLKVLYDAKEDEIKRKNELLNQMNTDMLSIKARITSYENFLQSRTLETDNLLKKLPVLMEAIATHLNIDLVEEGMNAHESAHSQTK